MKTLSERLQADESSLTRFVAVLCLCWMGVEVPDEFKISLLSVYERAVSNDFSWLAMEAAFLLGELELEGQGEEYARRGEEYRSRLGCRSIVSIIATERSWKHSLQELITLTSTVREGEQVARLVWLVHYSKGRLYFQPREQKRKADGTWSKGRSIALSRFVEQRDLDFLTAQDRRICASLHPLEDSAAKGSRVQL